jgi:hypothetical protein
MGTGLGVPEANIQGNSLDIIDGDVTAGTVNHTDFGTVNVGDNKTRSFTIQNNGTGALTVSNITFTGANAGEFTLPGASAFPWNIPSGASQSVTVQFQPMATGSRIATINIANNDSDEGTYDFALTGTGAGSTGIGMQTANASLSVYPNPSRDVVTVAMDMRKDANVVINVTDMQGKEVLPAINKDMKAGENFTELSTENLANGVYFLRVSDGASSTNIKLVVMH